MKRKEEEKKEWERQKGLPEISPIRCLHTPKFWTKIIEQGLFYPQTATQKNGLRDKSSHYFTRSHTSFYPLHIENYCKYTAFLNIFMN